MTNEIIESDKVKKIPLIFPNQEDEKSAQIDQVDNYDYSQNIKSISQQENQDFYRQNNNQQIFSNQNNYDNYQNNQQNFPQQSHNQKITLEKIQPDIQDVQNDVTENINQSTNEKVFDKIQQNSDDSQTVTYHQFVNAAQEVVDAPVETQQPVEGPVEVQPEAAPETSPETAVEPPTQPSSEVATSEQGSPPQNSSADGETSELNSDVAEDGEELGLDQEEEGDIHFQSDRGHFFVPHRYSDDDEAVEDVPPQIVAYRSVQNATDVVQSLCNTNHSYLLNDSNWFKIGLQNNHRQEYSMLITELKELFNDPIFYVAFDSNGDICVASNNVTDPVNLDQVLLGITGKSLNDYQASEPFFELDQQPLIEFFQLKAAFMEDEIEQIYKSKIYDFELSTTGEYQSELVSGVQVSVDKVVFIQDGQAILYFGVVQTENLQTRVHFAHDQLTRSQNILDLFIDLADNSVTLSSLLIQTFGIANTEAIEYDLQISRGIQDLHNQRLQKVILSINRSQNNFQLIASNEDLVDFAVSPQLNLFQCSSKTIINSVNNIGTLDSMHIHCSIREFPDIVYAHLVKTPYIEQLTIKLENSEYNLDQFQEHVVYILNNNQTLSYQDELNQIFDGATTYIHKVQISVHFTPKLIYVVDGEIGVTGWQNVGNFQMALMNINENMREFLQIHFGPEPLEHFLGRIAGHSFPDSLNSKSTLLFFSPISIDISQYSQLQRDDFGPYEKLFWERGLYIQHTFDIKEDCGDSKMCRLIWDKNLPTIDLTIKGYVLNFTEECILYGDFVNFSIADNLPMINNSITLPIILLQNETYRDVNEVENDFFITGLFSIPLQNSQINFKGKLFYNWANQGVLMNTDVESWEQAFDFPQLNFHQLKIKGFINPESPFDLEYFTMTGLGVFGYQCFYEIESGEIRFERDTCFYGNMDVKLDFDDNSNNFFEGFFTDVNMMEMLTVLLDYDALIVYEKINRAILESTIVRGCTISYATKNIVNNVERIVLVPQGITIQSSINFLGLDGSLVMNILDNVLVGVFHFSTVSFAEGNIIIFEEDLENSNNILLRIDPSVESKDDQIIFRTRANIFDQEREVYIFISEIQGFSIQINDQLFQSPYNITVDIKAPYNSSLMQAVFTATSEFSQEHIQNIEVLLKQNVRDWMQKVSKLLDTLHDHVDNLHEILVKQQSKVCQQEQCPLQTECRTPPSRQCHKYRQKQVCDQEEEYCLNSTDVCLAQQEECIFYEQVCLEFGPLNQETGDRNCLREERVCRSLVSLCRVYRTQCISERIITCAAYRFIDDIDECEEYQFGCETHVVADSTCQQECQRRNESFLYYQDLYQNQQNSLNSFESRLIRYQALVEQVNEDPDGFIQIVSAGFEKVLDEPIRSRNLVVQFKIMSFARALLGEEAQVDTFDVESYDFQNDEHNAKVLTQQILIRWAQHHQFDPIIISNDPSELIQSIFGENLENATLTSRRQRERDAAAQSQEGGIIEIEHELRQTQGNITSIVDDLADQFQAQNDQEGNLGQNNLQQNLMQRSTKRIPKKSQFHQYKNHEFISLYHLISKSINDEDIIKKK